MNENKNKEVPDIDILSYKGTVEEPDIKIFVSHRIDLDSETIDNPMFVDVRCGAIFDERENIDMIGDDTGDNISDKRMTFCELTVQYWAWKNIEADYYGLCHYRRYLNFSKYSHVVDVYGNVVENEKIQKSLYSLYGFHEKDMRNMIKKFDIIVSSVLDISTFPQKYSSVKAQWCDVDHLDKSVLDITLNIISRIQPNYINTAQSVLNGRRINFCNLHVMRKTIYFDYNQWLFSILFALEKELNISLYSEEGQRIFGHLGERLLAIYVEHLRLNNESILIKELQPIFFVDYLKDVLKVSPLIPTSNKEVIPLVFSSSNEFLPICAVAVYSVIKNANPDLLYEIVILTTTVTKTNELFFCDALSSFKNIKITFFNVSALIKNYNLQPSEHITVETYYRFLIPEILNTYEKVLYLDSDIICNHDISELFHIDIGENLIGAVYDVDVIGSLNVKNSQSLEYNIKKLGLDNPYEYFQAGVLIINNKEFKKLDKTSEFLRMACEKFRFVDQDILNKICYGRVHYIDMSWNVLCDCQNYRVPVTLAHAPADISKAYHIARKSPSIVHYAGCEKPWNMRGVDLEHYFWKYARETSFYETLLINLVPTNVVTHLSNEPNIGVKGAMKIYIRKKGEKLCPKGTRRRKIAKKMLGWMIK